MNLDENEKENEEKNEEEKIPPREVGLPKITFLSKKLARRARWLALWAGLQAGFLRLFGLFSTLYIIGGGLAVGCLSLFLDDPSARIAVSVLGFSITAVKGAVTLLGAEARAVRLKSAQLRLRALSTELSLLSDWSKGQGPDLEAGEGGQAEANTNTKRKQVSLLRLYAAEVDQISLAIFAAGTFPREGQELGTTDAAMAAAN